MKEELARLRELVERTQSVVSHADASTACEVLPALLDCVEALSGYVAAYPAFRVMPVGAPGSQARLDQDKKIAMEDAAKAALARLRETMKEQG